MKIILPQGETNKSGVTRREQLEGIWKQRIREKPEAVPDSLKPEGIEEPEIPFFILDVWELFGELSRTRESGFGIGHITWSEIYSYQQLTGNYISPWMIKVIHKMDNVYVEYMAKKFNKGN